MNTENIPIESRLKLYLVFEVKVYRTFNHINELCIKRTFYASFYRTASSWHNAKITFPEKV